MSKLILKSSIEDIIPLCEDAEFVKTFNGRMSAKLLKIINLRHGHTEHGRLNYEEITNFIKRQDRYNDEPVTRRYINILYFRALAKIKELMYEKQ